MKLAYTPAVVACLGMLFTFLAWLWSPLGFFAPLGFAALTIALTLLAIVAAWIFKPKAERVFDGRNLDAALDVLRTKLSPERFASLLREIPPHLLLIALACFVGCQSNDGISSNAPQDEYGSLRDRRRDRGDERRLDEPTDATPIDARPRRQWDWPVLHGLGDLLSGGGSVLGLPSQGLFECFVLFALVIVGIVVVMVAILVLLLRRRT